MINKTYSKEVMNALLRSNLKSFIIKSFPELSGGDTYMDNWHIDCIASELLNLKDGHSQRLVINIPPRYMKSIICSTAFPAWLLGKNPKTKIICVSYSDELARKLGADCRKIMETDWYKEAFPGTRIDPSCRAVDLFSTTAGGSRLATGTGGALTGHGGDWIIVDDPIKPQEAQSNTVRNKCNEWYRSTLLSRFNQQESGKLILVMQRLHEEDLCGYALSKDSSFRHLCLPIIADQDQSIQISPLSESKQVFFKREKGSLLHPERDRLATVEHMRAQMGDLVFAAQYQQNPIPLDGAMVKKSSLQFYKEKALPRFSSIILSWDTAAKTGEHNAFSVCTTVGIGIDKKFYLLNCFRAKLSFNELVKQCNQTYYDMMLLYPRVKIDILIEDASSGTFMADELKRQYALNAIKIQPTKSKLERFASITPQIENGSCLFPSFEPEWWNTFMSELISFPDGKYADQCDSFSQAIEYAKNKPPQQPRFAFGVSGSGSPMNKFAYKDPKDVTCKDLQRHRAYYKRFKVS